MNYETQRQMLALFGQDYMHIISVMMTHLAFMTYAYYLIITVFARNWQPTATTITTSD